MPFLEVTEHELAILRGMVRDHVSRSKNPTRRSQIFDDDSPQAPECYIALVPAGGIPALEPAVGTGTAGFTEGDRPGSEDCTVYRIVNEQLVLVGRSLKVWNLSESEISQQWISVKREKFGAWLADTGGGGESCPDRNEIQAIFLTRGVDSGSFIWKLKVNGVTEDITINFDDTATEIKTAVEGHSEIAVDDVAVTGGPLPTTSIVVQFQGNLAGKLIPVGQTDVSLLVGDGSMAILVRNQRGYPGDATDA